MAVRFPGTLSARITIGFMVLVVTFGGISLSTVMTIDKLNQAIRITHAGYVNLVLDSSELANRQNALRRYLREELKEESSERLARRRIEHLLSSREALLEQVATTLADVSKMEIGSPTQFQSSQQRLAQIREAIAETRSHYEVLLRAPPIGGLVEDDTLSEAERQAREEAGSAQKTLLKLELRIGQLTTDFKRRETSMLLKLSEELDRFSRKTWLFTLIWGATAVLLGVFMTIGATVMLRPLRRLRDAASRIAHGDYAHRIDVAGPREIADLATEFNVMGQAIEEREQELVRAARLATIGRMAASITHEVRNPLSSIGLNAELLEEELSQLPAERSDEARALCRAINQEVDRLTALTEEYLQFARLPDAKMHEESLERVVETTCDFMREELTSQKVELDLDMDTQAPLMPLDEGQIRRMLMNLLRNACEAIAPRGGGTVEVRVRHDAGNAVITVADDGPGIPEALLKSIFEPFVTQKEGGTGLGLALSQQIVTEHGGSIRARNREAGGAEFLVELPHTRAPVAGFEDA